MAMVRTTERSAACHAKSRVFDAEIERVTAGGEPRFPNYSSFFASDFATDEEIREAHARGFAAVIVDEHEHVTVLPAPDPSIAERESERLWRELGGES
jgi:hypothetical protein